MLTRTGRAALFALMVASLYGCAAAVSSGYGQGGMNADGRSFEEANADNRITAAVNTLLVKERTINSMDIDVSTLNGVVTMEGRVPSRTISYRAQSLAASVDGVKRVINRLRIAP